MFVHNDPIPLKIHFEPFLEDLEVSCNHCIKLAINVGNV